MRTVLVTGANGFVGSHILEALTACEGVAPIAACRDRRKLLPSFKGEVRQGDLRDEAYLRAMLQGVDVVCHAAAWTSAWNHEQASERLFLKPSLSLIEHAIVSGVKRFVFLSSTSVAAPHGAGDTMCSGDLERLKLWPHMRNVALLENYMQEHAHSGCVMVNMRVGLFAGRRYGLGLLPLLLPRLKTHLVPWVAGGRTSMPVVAGSDIGQAFVLAATVPALEGYEAFYVVGPSVPTAREVITYLNTAYGVPKPHFRVPFFGAYAFARLMEVVDPVVPWEPLVTRSIVHLLEETSPSNERAHQRLGYRPKVGWKDAIRMQMDEMLVRQKRPMRMHKPLES